MVVDKRTVLNGNRERVDVRWTAKSGNEIDLIGQLNVTRLLGHSRGQQDFVRAQSTGSCTRSSPISVLLYHKNRFEKTSCLEEACVYQSNFNLKQTIKSNCFIHHVCS